MKIKVMAKEDVLVYNDEKTRVLCEVQADDILVATLEEETEEFVGMDSKGREVYVAEIDYLGELSMHPSFIRIKEC